MDYARQSVASLLRGPLLFTPQGKVVLFTWVVFWAWGAYVLYTGSALPFKKDVGSALVIAASWPFIVFLLFVRGSMPYFKASWGKACYLALVAAALPLYLAYPL